MSDWLVDEDAAWDDCNRRAWDLYKKVNILSHERVAYEIGYFLRDRISEQPATAESAALLSVVRWNTRIATYLSSGDKAIRSALAVLLRLVQPYAEHPEYSDEWKPLEYDPSQLPARSQDSRRG